MEEEKIIQTHHISYNPEITIDILKELHERFHGHEKLSQYLPEIIFKKVVID